jgi:hypothetical protein
MNNQPNMAAMLLDKWSIVKFRGGRMRTSKMLPSVRNAFESLMKEKTPD